MRYDHDEALPQALVLRSHLDQLLAEVASIERQVEAHLADVAPPAVPDAADLDDAEDLPPPVRPPTRPWSSHAPVPLPLPVLPAEPDTPTPEAAPLPQPSVPAPGAPTHPLPRSHGWGRRPWQWALLGGLLALLVSVGVLGYSTLLAPTVTITLVPASHPLSATLTLSGLPARPLPALTLSQARTLAAATPVQQAATRASGVVTFYNGSQAAQQVPAGTPLTSASGVQIVTARAVTVPGSWLPSVGAASVAAHALLPGAGGNLAAHTLDGQVTSVLQVRNLDPFEGGQDARTYLTVPPADAQAARAALVSTLTAGISSLLQAQARAGEVTTVSACRQHTTTNGTPGTPLVTLTLTVTLTCQGVAYAQDALTSEVQAALTQQATRAYGPGYAPTGPPQVQGQTVRLVSPGTTAQVTLTATTTVVKQFDPAALEHLARLVAGHTRAQATALLLAQAGVAQAGVNPPPLGDRLPTDPARIRVLVVYRWA